MSNSHDRPQNFGYWILWGIKAIVGTFVAAVLWFLATLVALILILVLASVWYVFFGTPVLGDFLGFLGGGGIAAMPLTRNTKILAGIMTLLVIALCVLVIWMWIQWQRRIFQKRRAWLR